MAEKRDVQLLLCPVKQNAIEVELNLQLRWLDWCMRKHDVTAIGQRGMAVPEIFGHEKRCAAASMSGQ